MCWLKEKAWKTPSNKMFDLGISDKNWQQDFMSVDVKAQNARRDSERNSRFTLTFCLSRLMSNLALLSQASILLPCLSYFLNFV